MRQWSSDPKVVPETIAAAGGKSGNASGVVNALVVLREAQPEALRANSAELVPFLDKVEANGPQTRALTAQVRERAGLPASAPWLPPALRASSAAARALRPAAGSAGSVPARSRRAPRR